jgi:hypothetical protein
LKPNVPEAMIAPKAKTPACDEEPERVAALSVQASDVFHKNRVAREEAHLLVVDAGGRPFGNEDEDRDGEDDCPDRAAHGNDSEGQPVLFGKPEPVEDVSDQDHDERHDSADVAESPAEPGDASDRLLRRHLHEHGVVVHAGELVEDAADRDERRTEHEVGGLALHEEETTHAEHEQDRVDEEA